MEILRYEQLDYVCRLPENFNEQEKYPLVIYLHGAGGRGRDTQLIYTHPFFSDTARFLKGAVSVAPQCYADSWFNIFEQLQRFIEYVSGQSYIDATRVYLIGASMGGYATWQMAMARPELFAAVVPICGGGMYWNGARLVNMGVWAFHGESDPVVFCEESKKMVKSVNDNGGNAKLTVYEGVEHNAWSPTFCNEELWIWLLKQKAHYKETKSAYDNVKQFG
ncbi:MAG: prolyl oligopeptidase family serine peptidase [Clostridia bacterium]|nr:prolyl oligopeptidase family serine peptidase [Clostridia bacterium]